MNRQPSLLFMVEKEYRSNSLRKRRKEKGNHSTANYSSSSSFFFLIDHDTINIVCPHGT